MKQVTDLLGNLGMNWKPKFPDSKLPIYEVFTQKKYGEKYKLIGEVTIAEKFITPFFWVVCYWTGDEPTMSKIYNGLVELLPDFDYHMVVF